jgi:NAD+ synthase
MIELYLKPDELKIYERIIVDSIRGRVEKAGAEGGVVALSGGADSSLVAVLTHSALGEGTVALIMPEEGISPDDDTQHALALSKETGIRHEVIDIREMVQWVEKRMPDDNYTEEHKRYHLANVKPRVRMIFAYLYANLENKIVVGTSNKTEILLGYGTKYGDLAADLYPIGDLYKTQVWQLAEQVGIPTEIIRKAPSAGLWKGQTDEAELGHTYAVIDRVLFALVELELSVREVSEMLGIPEEAVRDIYTRVVRSEHKRKPPTFTRLSKMCLDKDWRYPVDRY